MSVADGYIAGIDEAGRGPVLGPMVYAICFAKLDDEEHVAAEKYSDSKTLSAAKREAAFQKIKSSDRLRFFVDVISAVAISTLMNRKQKFNLNRIAQHSTFKLISRVLAQKVNLVKVYVDTVGPWQKHQRLLKARFPAIDFCVREKADSLFPIVSAASICAKVTRDACLKYAAQALNIESDVVGSGYPNDPTTIKFLNSSYDPLMGFPDIVRTSWATAVRAEERFRNEAGANTGAEAMAAGPKAKRKPTAKGIGVFFGKESEGQTKKRKVAQKKRGGGGEERDLIVSP